MLKDKPIVLAFCGVKRSGKTTTFNIVDKNFDNVEEIMLAKNLKDISAEVCKVPRDHFELQEFKEKDLEIPVFLEADMVIEMITKFGLKDKMEYDKHVRPHVGKMCYTPRQIAQYVGTEILRNIQDDIHCAKAVEAIQDNNKIYVVTDLRFPNEHKFFSDKDCYFFPFYIKRTVAEDAALKDKHPSEQLVIETAKSCTVIDNNRTIPMLEKLVLETIGDIING